MPADDDNDLKRHHEYSDERDMDSFWAEIEPRAEPMRQRWFVPLILLLLIVSVPWYRTEGEIGTMLHGLPVWVWVTIACSVGISAVTAIMALWFWDDDES